MSRKLIGSPDLRRKDKQFAQTIITNGYPLISELGDNTYNAQPISDFSSELQ